jgi:hypothetical protein
MLKRRPTNGAKGQLVALSHVFNQLDVHRVVDRTGWRIPCLARLIAFGPHAAIWRNHLARVGRLAEATASLAMLMIFRLLVEALPLRLRASCFWRHGVDI